MKQAHLQLSDDLVLCDCALHGKGLWGHLSPKCCSENLSHCPIAETAASDSFPSYSLSVCPLFAIPNMCGLWRAANWMCSQSSCNTLVICDLLLAFQSLQSVRQKIDHCFWMFWQSMQTLTQVPSFTSITAQNEFSSIQSSYGSSHFLSVLFCVQETLQMAVFSE